MTNNTDSNPFVARDLIEQAKGIIMERFDLDAAGALAVLRRMSQNTSTQMCVVAAQVINHHVPLDAVRGIEEDVLGHGDDHVTRKALRHLCGIRLRLPRPTRDRDQARRPAVQDRPRGAVVRPRAYSWPETAPLLPRHRMAFYETVMVKGYETLVDSDTEVDVNTGMIAAGRLQALIESRASGTRIADLRVQMGRIIDAVHSTVPEELWPEILRKIDGPVAAETPADELEDGDDAADMYDPRQSAKADKDCWTATVRRDPPVEGRRAPTRAIEAPSPAMPKFTPKTVKDDDDF